MSHALISRWLRPSRRCTSPTRRLRSRRSSARRSKAAAGPARLRPGARAGTQARAPVRDAGRAAPRRASSVAANSALSGTKSAAAEGSLARRCGGLLQPSARLLAPQHVAQLAFDRRRRGHAASDRPAGTASSARRAVPGLVRTKRPTIWRKISGVLAAVAYTPTRRRGMSTPSETMFTATIHGSRELRNVGELARGVRLGVQDDERRASGGLVQQPARSGARGSRRRPLRAPPASRCPSARSPRSFASASLRIRGSPSGSSVEIAVR